MRRKAVLLAFILLVASTPLLASLVDVTTATVDVTSFGTKQKVGNYAVSQGETADWYYLKIDQEITDYDESTSHDIEYVGFSKNVRGDIAFTSNGEYVARLIPVVCGKVGGNWWLVPIRGVDAVSTLGVENGTDEAGDYTEIYYGGSGTFTSYQYDNYGTQQNVELTINRMAVRCYLETGECKVKADVSFGVTPQDTGFGFIFYPTNPQQFRYMKYTVGGTTKTVDLSTVQKISDVGKILEFWSQAGQRLGIKWKWQDLYELGTHSHFEILDIQGLYGLLTGSYGYGSSNTIVVDPSLIVSEDASELSVINTWNSGTEGYNFTFLQSAMVMDRLYNYATSEWIFDGDQADADSSGMHIELLTDDPAYYYSKDNTASWEVSEESDVRTTLTLTGSAGTYTWEWQITCYAVQPGFFWRSVTTNTGAEDVIDEAYFWITDDVQDDSNEPDMNADAADDVYVTNCTGHGGVYCVTLTSNDDGGDDWDEAWEYQDSNVIEESDDTTLSTDEAWSWTMLIGVHSEDSLTDAVSLADEIDDEVCDDFPAVSGESGITYDGRNNSTGAFDFTHSSGNDASFTFTDIDTEQNFTAFHIDDWDSAYLVRKDSVLQTEDTDYYASLQAYALDFDGDDYVSCTCDTANYSAFSMFMWVYIGTKQGEQLLVNELGDDSLWFSFDCGYSDEKLNARLMDTSEPTYFHSSSTVSRGTWHHIGLTYDNSTATLYLDGATNGTHSTNGTVNFDGSFSLGRHETVASYLGYEGSIEEFLFYSRTLDSTEISDLYSNKIPQNLTNLVCWYNFNQGGSTAEDRSGNGNDGTVTGATYTVDTNCMNGDLDIVYPELSTCTFEVAAPYFTLTMQARDAAGTNLPRTVTFEITHANSTETSDTSNSAGLATREVLVGRHTLVTKWGTHQVDSQTVAVGAADQTVNVDTKIRRLDSDSSYVLFSLNDTDLPAPEVVGEADWQLRDVTASGSIPFKMDNQNWKRPDEPESFTVGESQYTKGEETWSWTDGVFTFTCPFSTKTLSMSWSSAEPPPEEQGGGGGGGGAAPPPTTIIPTLPIPELPEIPVVLPSPITKFPEWAGAIIIGGVIVGAVAYHEARARKKGSPRKSWKKQRKNRNPDWREHKRRKKKSWREL